MTLADATIWLFLSLSVPALLPVILGPDNQKKYTCIKLLVTTLGRLRFLCRNRFLGIQSVRLPQIASSPYHTTKKLLELLFVDSHGAHFTMLQSLSLRFASVVFFFFLSFPFNSFGSCHVDT